MTRWKTTEAVRVWWPCFVAGLLAPFAARTLHRWMPLYVATFFAFVVLWIAAGLVFIKVPPDRTWTFRGWVVGALAGAAVGAVITYFLPWA